MGERGSAEIRQKIERELGLDLSFGKQFLLYLNDLSPLSVHNPNESNSRIYLDDEDYSYYKVIGFSENRTLVLKKPYLRRSYQNGRSVSEIIAESFPGTALLAIIAIGFALIVGIFVGVISALNKGSFFDRSSLFLAVLGMSGPSFFMAIIISWVGGYLWYEYTSLPLVPVVFLFVGIIIGLYGFFRSKGGIKSIVSLGFKWLLIGTGIWIIALGLDQLFGVNIIPMSDVYLKLPGTGLNQTGSLKEVDVFSGPYFEWKNIILPALTLGIRPLAVIIQLTRNSMIDVMQQDYIRTARAKGLNDTKIVISHALRNALSPVITAVSGWFASMLSGAVFIEYVFGWQGLGLRIFEALLNEDMPLVMGSVLFIAIIFVFINVVVDILYGLLDPRIRIS